MEETDFIPTKGSLVKAKTPKDFKVVTFEAYKPKGKRIKVEEDDEDSSNNIEQLNMKRARFEIIKLGMSGFEGQKKQEAKIALAVKLGAKPPRNKYVNYKKILEEKQKLKEEQAAKLELQQVSKNSAVKTTTKGKSFDPKRKKLKSGLLDIYGTVKPSEINKFKNKNKKHK